MKKNKKLKEMQVQTVTYSFLAEQAVLFEQSNDTRAVDFWIQASKIARNSDNREWAEHRAAFCERWIEKDKEITDSLVNNLKVALRS